MPQVPTAGAFARRAGALNLATSFAVFVALAVVATWPMVLDLDGQLLFHQRRFDGYGTVWFGEHTWRAITGGGPWLSTTDVAWPAGLDLRQADSFLYGLLYVPLRIFCTPVEAFNLFSLLAIALTGTAGFWMARGPLGTGNLPALGAGVVLAFNSLMHTYRIEGEAYLLGAFLLPVLAGHLVVAARGGSPRAGVYAALALTGLAWSSGYYAIDGALIAASLGVCLLLCTPARGPRWPGVVAFSGVSLVLILPLAWLVLGALDAAVGARVGAEDPLSVVALDSVSLSGILVPYPETAHLRQGRIHYIGAVALVLGLGALTARKPRETLPWLSVFALGGVLALGPTLRLDDAHAGTGSLLYAWLYELSPAILAYRMPARFMALAFLGLAALSALFLDQLAREGLSRRWRLGFLGLLLIDGLVLTGTLGDETSAPAEVPSGYAGLSGEGAVLDLWGRDRDMLKYAGLSAFYQAHHGQPAMTDFTRTGSAQDVLSHRLSLALVEMRSAEVGDVLSVLDALGVSDIALHSASFHEADAARIRDGLEARCEAITGDTDVDDTDPVEIFRVPSSKQLEADEAQDLLAAWMEPA